MLATPIVQVIPVLRANAALLADLVLTLHVLLALFVVSFPLYVLLGYSSRWRLVDSLFWRSAHLACILVIAAESLFQMACPLTTLEMTLRNTTSSVTYRGGCVEHWLQRLLFYQAPPYVFILVYIGFAVCVLGLWWRLPPRRDAKVDRSRD